MTGQPWIFGCSGDLFTLGAGVLGWLEGFTGCTLGSFMFRGTLRIFSKISVAREVFCVINFCVLLGVFTLLVDELGTCVDLSL